MSQKKAKKDRKIRKGLTELLKAQTYNVVSDYMKKTGKDFDTLDPLERIRIVSAAKNIATQDVNVLLQRSTQGLSTEGDVK